MPLRIIKIIGLAVTLCSVTMLTACGGSNDNSAALTSVQLRLNELEAREAIRELFTDYGRTLDSRDFKKFGTLYSSDSEYVGGGASGSAKGPEEIAAMLEKVITTNASGANLHMYFNEKIDVDVGSGTASAISRGAFYVQNETGGPLPLIFATYKDEFIQENGRWLFKRREVIGDIPGPSNEDRAAQGF